MQLGPRFSKQSLVALCLGAVIVALCAFPALASASFNVSGFQLTPSSKQAAGHPTLTFKFTRSGALNEDLRDVEVEYPEGQLFNPEAAVTKCTDAQFNADLCPADSYVGSVNLAVQKEWYWNPTYNVRGSVYVLEAAGSDHAVLGYALRPPSAFSPKVFLKQVVNLTADPTAPVTTTPNTPRTQSWWFPRVMGTSNIAIKSLVVMYNARANPWRNGPSFVLNPSSCDAKGAKLTATSYQDAVSTATVSWTPVGCSYVPFDPSVSVDVDNHDSGAATGASFSLNVPTVSRSVQNSTVAGADFDLANGTGLDLPYLQGINGAVGCSEAQLAVDACPVATRIGGGGSTMPFYPPAFTGDLYLMDASSTPAKLALVLRGPRGLRSIVRAELSATGSGASSSTRLSITDTPEIPLGNLSIDLEAPVITNPVACPQDVAVTAAIRADAGQVASRNAGYAITCAPVSPQTTLDSAPSGLVGDATQTFTFGSDRPDASFECEIDGDGSGPWSACASPFTSSFLDGAHSFRVRAVSGGQTDSTPAVANFEVDDTPPVVTFTSPAPNSWNDASILISFAATDPHGATTFCTVNSAPYNPYSPCSSPYDGIAYVSGSNTVKVVAVDNLGNQALYTLPVQLDFDEPTASISGCSKNPDASANCTFVYEDPAPASGVAAVECAVDGDAYATCDSPWQTPVVGQGSHTFKLRVTDAVGQSLSMSQGFYVDTIAPVVSISSPASGSIISDSTPALVYSVTEAHPFLTRCSIDGGAFATCPVSSLPALADGTHTIAVRHIDTSGNSGTAASTFTIDTADPAVSISSPTEGQVLAGTSTMQGIGTGGASSCAIDVAGGLLCWGWNASGQLGDGTTSDHSAPVAVPSLASGVVQVDGGQRHKCALLDDGTVKCWGWNSWGQVGDGTTVDKLTPTTVPGLTNVVKISAGDYHTCAVRDDGILHCWGRYTFGGASSSTPVAIAGIGNATDVQAGSSFTCALLSDGGVKCFGENGYGELGTGSWSYGSAAPVSVTGISDAVKLAAGASHSCVVTSAGSVKCWGWNGGYNGHFILGNGSTDDYSTTPTQVLGLTSGAADVALGAVHSCARMVDGTVLCWGSNGHGQRGYPGATSATPPTVASGLSGVLELKSGTNHLCARTATGVKCWGYNIYGQIGDGTTISRNLPTSVVGLDSLTGMTPLTYTVVEANPGTVECSLDGGAFASCPSGIDTSALADGSYTLTVRAVDQVGNAGEATVNFIVDKTAPVVTIDSPDPLVTYNGDPVPLSFSVTEANPGTTTCSIDGGTPGACPASVDLDGGFHTVQVSHIDAAGNAGSATVQYLVQLEVPPPVIISPSGVTGDDTPVLVFSLAAPGGTTLCVVDDGEAFLCASGDDLGPLSDGPHTISVTVITDEGDVGTAVQAFTVDTSSPVDTQISVGPEGGLAITDPTPEWEFISDDPSATFECSVDSGAWSSCSSPFTAPSFDTGDGQGGAPNGKIDADETGAHTFEARAVVAGTPDSTPDTAAFTLAEFAPQFSVELADPSDPSDLDGNDATANPDVKLTATNLVGDPGTAALNSPDHMWLAQAAVPACSTTDAGVGDCLEASRIGDVAFTFMVNREPHDSIAGLHSLTVTGAVYLTQRWVAGESMGAVAEFDIVDGDGRNYGKVNQRIHLTLDHLSTDDASTAAVEENTSVSNPPHVTVSAEPLPGKTPLAVDGAMLELHQVGSELELWGSRSHYDRPLTHNSADCTSTPSPEAGTPVQWAYRVADGSASDPVELTQSYSVDNCDQVPFSLNVDELRFDSAFDPSQSSDAPLNPPPRQVDNDGDLIPDMPTPLTAQMRFSIPPGSSTVRKFSVDLPGSVKQRIDGLIGACAGTDTQVNVDRDLDLDGTVDKHNYVACDLDNSMVGNIEITSPLFETAQYGELFIEDEPLSALPSIYAVIRNEDLGLNLRLRARADIVTSSGGHGFMRLSFNFGQWVTPADLPSIPLSSVALTLPGTNMNGPILEVNSACHDQDAATVNALSWSDSDADGDGKTVTTMGPKSYFGSADSPCLPVDTDLVDNPADADPGASPTAGDTTTDDTPSWIANREYSNISGTVRHVWFECSTDQSGYRACGDFTPYQDEVVRLVRSGSAPSGTSCYNLIVDGQSTSCIVRTASAAAVQTSLESLPNITPGCVTVTGTAPSLVTNSFFIMFKASCYPSGVFPVVSVTLGSGWTPAATTLAIQSVTVGAAGTWGAQVEEVPAGDVITHSRAVTPQSDQLPLGAGDGHKFAVRLKSSATFPSLATANSGSPVGLETYSSPYPLSPSIETPFMVAP